jgi:glycosyltransferase involved in cell wall biosynthesis
VKPVLFVTNHVPPARVGAFAALAARTEVEFALYGGKLRHGASMGSGPSVVSTGSGPSVVPALRVSERAVHALAASGRYRAVIAGTGGRVALPAAYLGARRAGVPFVLWASLWAHPKTPAHALSWPLLRHLYRAADAVVTYGPHVSAYVRAHGARKVFEAPQAVDNGFWSGPVSDQRRKASFQVVFTGRGAREKGLTVLGRAWRASGLQAPHAALVLVGGGRPRSRASAASAAPLRSEGAPAVHAVGALPPHEVRNFLGSSDVCAIPSIPTLTFREPWGLVANEAMNQGLPVIATDAVGAAAGGLVRHEQTGLVVPAGDHVALAGAIRRLNDDPALRARLGVAGRQAVSAYTFDAWAQGVLGALTAAEEGGSSC